MKCTRCNILETEYILNLREFFCATCFCILKLKGYRLICTPLDKFISSNGKRFHGCGCKVCREDARLLALKLKSERKE